MSIGTKIRQIRDDKKISQKDLAEAIGMTQANLHKLESDKIKAKLETVEKISSFFGVSLDELRDVEKATVRIETNQNNLNQKVSSIMLNFSDEDLIEILKKQIVDKEEIIGFKNERIRQLEESIAALLATR